MDTEERDELNDDELLIASQAWALEGKSFAPTAEFAPVCEALVERGWLSKWSTAIDGESEDVDVYTMTPEGRAAMEMAGLIAVEPARLN
jgi:hypothetical protein